MTNVALDELINFSYPLVNRCLRNFPSMRARRIGYSFILQFFANNEAGYNYRYNYFNKFSIFFTDSICTYFYTRKRDTVTQASPSPEIREATGSREKYFIYKNKFFIPVPLILRISYFDPIVLIKFVNCS